MVFYDDLGQVKQFITSDNTWKLQTEQKQINTKNSILVRVWSFLSREILIMRLTCGLLIDRLSTGDSSL